jgi:hypothetical protein
MPCARYRNRLAKLEQALRNNDEPRDPGGTQEVAQQTWCLENHKK